jgi:hypothetical protein
MTIKNIMFSGVMAVILGAVVAPAMAVEVTSKKYVDEKVVAAVASKAEQTALTQEIAAREAADQDLSGQISSETTAREAADNSLQSQIDNKVAATQETTNGVVTTDATGKVQVSTAISQDQVVGLKDALSALPTDVTVAGKVDKEQGAENANKVIVTNATGAITAAAMIEQAQVDGLVDALGAKASQTDLNNLSSVVEGKADKTELAGYVPTATYNAGQATQNDAITALQTKDTELAGQINAKADSSALADYVQTTVFTQSQTDQTNALEAKINAKADAQTVTDLATEVSGKASQTALDNLSTVVDGKQAQLIAGDGIEIDAETNTITATAEAIEYTSGDAYVTVNNATDQITVKADAAIAAGATGLATSQAVMNYTLPVPEGCDGDEDAMCVLGVDKGTNAPRWLKLEMGE